MKQLSYVKLQAGHARRILLSAAAVSGLLASHATAGTVLTDLGSAGSQNWAILTDSSNPHMNGPGTTTGNVGVMNPNAVLSLDSSNAWGINGNVSLNTGGSVSHPAEVNGSILNNQATVLNNALTDATNARATFSGLTATNTTVTSIAGAMTINSSGLGATNVIDVSTINLGSGTLTLHGGANDQFIINDAGGLTLTSGHIVLTGGLTASDVVFNVTGDVSTSGGLNNESIINGIVLAGPKSSIQMSPGQIDGELISLNTGDFQIVSGGNVNQPGAAPCPEPASVFLISSAALLGFGVVGRRRFQQRSVNHN